MMAKGTTSMPDLQPLVTATHTMLHALNVKWWMEWIPSKSNPADEPSRDGQSSLFPNRPMVIPKWAIPSAKVQSIIEQVVEDLQ